MYFFCGENIDTFRNLSGNKFKYGLGYTGKSFLSWLGVPVVVVF